MSDSDEVDVGSPAPDFELPAAGGGSISLSSHRGHQNVLLFFMREFI